MSFKNFLPQPFGGISPVPAVGTGISSFWQRKRKLLVMLIPLGC